jgi:hypothetical protein
MNRKSTACAGRRPPNLQQPADTITIPRAEYDSLSRAAALLDIILHDHTPYHDAVGIVKNVLIDQRQAEAGGGQ